MKANSNKEILEFLSSRVDGYDVASPYEFEKARVHSSNISITSPGFTNKAIVELYHKGYLFDFNSQSQLEQCHEYLDDKKIGIRVSLPDAINVSDSRFGFNPYSKKLSEFVRNNGVLISKLHFHSADKSDKYKLQIKKDLQYMFEVGIINPNELRLINLGGGFIDLLTSNKLGDFIHFIDSLKEKFFAENNDIKFIIESGSALTFYSGFLVTKVLTVDEKGGNSIVVVDSSAHNLLRWIKPIPLLTKGKDYSKKRTTIYGNTCFENDIFSKEIIFSQLDIDDKIVFFPVGSYSHSNYSNLHCLPFPEEKYYYDKEFID